MNLLHWPDDPCDGLLLFVEEITGGATPEGSGGIEKRFEEATHIVTG